MKLYPIPGGLWAGTEADWKKQMKALGFNPKDYEATKTREVPTAKGDLMEFLTFFAVDVYRMGQGTIRPAAAPDTVVDVDALRALHNPDPDAPAPQPTEDVSTATVQLSRMENPGLDIDGMIAVIVGSSGHALKRFAGAVAGAFAALAA